MQDHVDKYYWLINHTGIGCKHSQATIELCPQLVNPETDAVDKETSLNTKPVWWAEYAKRDKRDDDLPTHFWELDCGGDTAEEAILKMYALALAKYGDYE